MENECEYLEVGAPEGMIEAYNNGMYWCQIDSQVNKITTHLCEASQDTQAGKQRTAVAEAGWKD